MNTRKVSSNGGAVDLDAVGKLIGQAKTIAKAYRELTGRPPGITGEVAEYEAARLPGLNLGIVRQVENLFDPLLVESYQG